MRLENKFQVPASPQKTWDLLIDVPRIVPCMPGAELTEVVGDDAWKAKIHVKIGPISLQFLSDIVREEMHEDEQRVKLSAHANEARGRGYAEATIESQLSPINTGTEVTIVTELALQGTVAQYGRGVVADVSTQLTKEFANGLERLLDEDQSPNGGAQAESSAGASAAGASGAGASGAGASGAGASSGGPQPGASGNPAPPAPPAAAPKPIGGVRLGLKAMWFGIGRRLRRLFGGKNR